MQVSEFITPELVNLRYGDDLLGVCVLFGGEACDGGLFRRTHA